MIECLAGAVFGAVIAFGFAASIWLVSMTTYPFDRTVGGATLAGAVVGAVIGLLAGVEAES